jgi:hypothetical protein
VGAESPVREKPDDRRRELLSAGQAAVYLNLSRSMLAKMRCLGGGPEYLKFGRTVRYDMDSLDDWSTARRARNTSDAARLPARLTSPAAKARPAGDRPISPIYR